MKPVNWPAHLMVATVLAAWWASGSQSPLAVVAAALLLLAPWIPWRFNPGRRLGEWLYLLLFVPFAFLALQEHAPSASAMLLSGRFTRLMTAYLVTLAIQEQYRGNSRYQVFLVHGALLGVLFHAGMGYEFKAYPIFVGVYLAAAVAWLRNALRAERGMPGRVGMTLGVILSLLMTTAVAGILFLTLPKAERQLDHMYDSTLFGSVPSLLGPLRESELGSLGKMFGSDAVMARVTGRNPQYMRALVLTTYAHDHWVPPIDPPADLEAGPTEPGGVLYRYPGSHPGGSPYRISVLEDTYRVILAPYGTGGVLSGAGPVYGTKAGILYSPTLSVDMQLDWYPGASEDFSGKRADDPSYLDVPSDLRSQIESLARRIVGSRTDPVTQADALLGWLQTNCQYNLSPPPPPVGSQQDRLETFLFVNHEGYCEYFATAMALMLRTLGVRSRYVLGYMVREMNTVGDYWVVRARDAHSWVEVYIPGKGWTIWDPTPPAEMDAMAAAANSTTWLSQLLDQYGLWFTRFWATVHSHDWRGFLRHGIFYLRSLLDRFGERLALLALPLLVGGWWWRRRLAPHAQRSAHARRGRTVEHDPTVRFLQGVLARVERRLGRTGQVRAEHETLAEFAGRVSDPGLHRLVAVYCDVRYGGRPLAVEERQELTRIR